MEGCGRNGAGLLGPRGQRGEPQAQPERQPGQVCRVVEKVKFQAGIHQALGTPVAADAGEWPRGEPLVSFSPARYSSPFHGAELASLEPGNLWSRFDKSDGGCEEPSTFLSSAKGESPDVSGVSAKMENMFERLGLTVRSLEFCN